MRKVDSTVQGSSPTHMFELCPSPHSVAEEKFRKHIVNDRSTVYAYHGSKIESFHSIMNYGLQQHLCKVRSICPFTFIIWPRLTSFFCLLCRTHYLVTGFTCPRNRMSACTSVQSAADGMVHGSARNCRAWLYANSSRTRFTRNAIRRVSKLNCAHS